MGDADLRAERFVLAMILMLFLLIMVSRHIYDVPTALFFTLALALLQRGNLRTYAWLFPIICLNRETAILLTGLFGVYFFSRLERRAYWRYLTYQIVVYLAVRLAAMWMFAEAPGSPMLFRPVENLQLYAENAAATQLFLLFVVTVICLVAARWAHAPELMRMAFLIFAPVLFLLYLVSGVSFEVRVFVELLPVVAVIAAT